jgi:hypothetical protein
MNHPETTRALVTCGILDRRFANPSPALVALWQRELEDVSYTAGINAIVSHYASNTEKITPDRIREGGQR